MLKLGLGWQDFVVVLLACGVMLTVSIMQNKGQVRDRLIRRPAAIRVALFALIVLLIMVFGAYGIGYDAGQFIYTQF